MPANRAAQTAYVIGANKAHDDDHRDANDDDDVDADADDEQQTNERTNKQRKK